MARAFCLIARSGRQTFLPVPNALCRTLASLRTRRTVPSWSSKDNHYHAESAAQVGARQFGLASVP